ncbi:hypothetical protein CL614_09470 [archaeon]|nr:hypothetical protein [archaeon]|tara:strand:- start:148 stop:615 length:468 start_codon:yes stop_codon:yes gene_type:complete
MEGIKHIIECHCVLMQHRNVKNPIYHKFVVFSIIDDSNTVVPKFVQCNNCDTVHKVFDICKSEIISGKDELGAGVQKDDLIRFFSQDLQDVLEAYNADLATYENVAFILEYKKWGSFVILTRETINDDETGKMLTFKNNNKFKIETFTNQVTLTR